MQIIMQMQRYFTRYFVNKLLVDDTKTVPEGKVSKYQKKRYYPCEFIDRSRINSSKGYLLFLINFNEVTRKIKWYIYKHIFIIYIIKRNVSEIYCNWIFYSYEENPIKNKPIPSRSKGVWVAKHWINPAVWFFKVLRQLQSSHGRCIPMAEELFCRKLFQSSRDNGRARAFPPRCHFSLPPMVDSGHEGESTSMCRACT